MERFIEVATHLYKLNNFNGVMKILSGLGKHNHAGSLSFRATV